MMKQNFLFLVTTLSLILTGCSANSNSSAIPTPPLKETLDQVLKTIQAEPGKSNEQILNQFCKAYNERGAELSLVKPVRGGAKLVAGKDGKWTIEVDVRDQSLGTVSAMTDAQAERISEQYVLDTKKGLASLASDLLENGKSHSLSGVRIAAYTPAKVKQPDGSTKDDLVLAYQIHAVPENLKKIIGWWLWPNFRPDGYPGDAKDRLEKDMWTVERNEYPNIQTKKR